MQEASDQLYSAEEKQVRRKSTSTENMDIKKRGEVDTKLYTKRQKKKQIEGFTVCRQISGGKEIKKKGELKQRKLCCETLKLRQ